MKHDLRIKNLLQLPKRKTSTFKLSNGYEKKVSIFPLGGACSRKRQRVFSPPLFTWRRRGYLTHAVRQTWIEEYLLSGVEVVVLNSSSVLSMRESPRTGAG